MSRQKQEICLFTDQEYENFLAQTKDPKERMINQDSKEFAMLMAFLDKCSSDSNNKVLCVFHWGFNHINHIYKNRHIMNQIKTKDQDCSKCQFISRQMYATIDAHKKNTQQTTRQKIIELANDYNKLIRDGDRIIGIWQIKQGNCSTILPAKSNRLSQQPTHCLTNTQQRASVNQNTQLSITNSQDSNEEQNYSSVISQQNQINAQLQQKVKYLEDKVICLENLLNKIVISSKIEIALQDKLHKESIQAQSESSDTSIDITTSKKSKNINSGQRKSVSNEQSKKQQSSQSQQKQDEMEDEQEIVLSVVSKKNTKQTKNKNNKSNKSNKKSIKESDYEDDEDNEEDWEDTNTLVEIKETSKKQKFIKTNFKNI